MNGFRLVVLMAVAEILAILPFAAFPALTPQFITLWHLSNSQAGWINGAYLIAYMVGVPFAMAATDRIDSRRIFAFGCAASAVTSIGFALFAGGFWSALFWRALSGVSLTCIYMPGLRALTDRIGTANQSRAVTIYTASYSVGVSLSFTSAGLVEARFGWPIAFAVSAIGPLLAVLVGLAILRPIRPPGGRTLRQILDIRPLLRNRPAMGYIIAYGAHGFELLGLRAWVTAFLAFSLTLQAADSQQWSAPVVSAVLTLIGLPAGIFGNELALRFGRRQVVTGIMLASSTYGLMIGFTADLPFVVVAGLTGLYFFLGNMDSGSITAGTIAATPDHRATALALHSTVGFAFAALGPLVIGFSLDFFGGAGPSLTAWGLSFAAMGIGALFGPLALWRLARDRPLARP